MEPAEKINKPDKSVKWTDRPSQRELGPKFTVIWPLWQQPVTAVALGNRVLGVQLHWIGHRTFPCFHEECPIDHQVAPTRWAGYLAVLVPGCRLPTVLAVSEAGFAPLDTLERQGNGLRGYRLRFTRSTPGRRSRVLVALVSEEKQTGLPPAFPVAPLLLQLWGLDPLTPPQAIVGDGIRVDVEDIIRLRVYAPQLLGSYTDNQGGAL
jgi:hypothetical protein